MSAATLVRTAAALLLLCVGSTATAQARLQVITEPGTLATVTEVLVAAGPMDEDTAQAGLAYLAARAVTDPIRPQLDALGAHLRVEAHKDAVAFSLVATPDAWEEASRILMLALFRDPPSYEAVLRQQQEIGAELEGRAANPADAAVRATDAALYGEDHPWGRPTVGTLQGVARLDPGQVDAFLRANFRTDRAVAVVLGPVEAGVVREHLRAYVSPAPWSPPAAAPPPPQGRAVEHDENTITTWVSAVYPFSGAADEEALRLLALRVTDALSFGPTRRSVFNVSSAVVPRARGGELRFQLVVPPEEAESWARQMQAAVEALAGRPLSRVEFEPLLRRYRGTRLLELGTPEARAREAARRLLTTGAAASPLPDFGRLSAEGLQAAARTLGEPTIVFLGPFFPE